METEVKENITGSRSNNNLLRFILIIGISFAIGGLVAGLIMIPGLYHIIWGAIGGFGVGIATKKDKKLFILLGGLGFGIASIVMSYLWGTWAVIIGAVTIGILEGALLGLYYKNTKLIGISALILVIASIFVLAINEQTNADRVFTEEELRNLYSKYNITENYIKFARGELPNFLEGTALDGKTKVIATDTGKPPEGFKEGVDYDKVISVKEAIAIEEDARQRYINKYSVDPANPKLDEVNGQLLPKKEAERLVKSGWIGLLFLSDIEPLRFSIRNSDINKHRITVEVFDSDNKSLFKETYEANPRERINSPEITKKKGEYTFKVTLDGKIEKSYKAEVGVGRSGVSIRLYEKVSGEIIPIEIGQAIA